MRRPETNCRACHRRYSWDASIVVPLEVLVRGVAGLRGFPDERGRREFARVRFEMIVKDFLLLCSRELH